MLPGSVCMWDRDGHGIAGRFKTHNIRMHTSEIAQVYCIHYLHGDCRPTVI